MIRCEKCGTALQDKDTVFWKCAECDKTFKIEFLKLKEIGRQKRNQDKSLLKCPSCGKTLDNGNEQIFRKCSSCENIIKGNLEFFTYGNVENVVHNDAQSSNLSSGLVECPMFGKEISNNVSECPHCSYPLEDNSINANPENDILTPADAEPNNAIDNNEEISSNTQNTIASILNFIGASILIWGTMGSFAIASESGRHNDFSFSVFAIYEFATILSGFIVIGMAQIIQLLHEINRSLKSSKGDPS